jgi:hypothetical protein
VFNNEDFWCAFFFDFWWFFFIFCVHFLHFLLPPIVKVDISDIAIMSVIPDMVKDIIGDNQYSSKNLSYCPINRFLESVTNLKPKCQKGHGQRDLGDEGPQDLRAQHTHIYIQTHTHHAYHADLAGVSTMV